MAQEKQSGFSLFPTPPTPPARKRRTTASTISTTRTTSNGSTKLVKKNGRGHGRKVSNVPDQPQPGLIPAPLKIRKASEEIPPLPILSPAFSVSPSTPSTPSRTRSEYNIPPKTPDGAPQLPAILQTSPMSPLPRTPTRNVQRLKARTVAEFVELDAGYKKRASSRISQWLDLEDGEVDRRRLSRYLGSVLGNTFEIPTFESTNRESLALLKRVSRYELESLVEQFESERCECPPDAIICHCSSSPEFERFRSWSNHKQNASISSTACLLGVPRARFHPTFFNVQDPTIAESSSPPGLSWDTEDNFSEAEDWSTPLTPSTADIFTGPSSRHKSYSSKYVMTTSPSSSCSTPSKFQSFSRPFRPDSMMKCMSIDNSEPATPSRQSKSCQPKGGFLTSISTVSSFDFDFDVKGRRESLAFQKLDFETLPQNLEGREQSSHLRTDSNESVASQYEVSTATATVAVSHSGTKPVLVTNTAKRANTPSSGRSKGSTSSTATSAKTSNSSISIPEYWHKYNAGLRAPRSRSATHETKASTDSVALSALLTMPLLPPRTTRPVDGPVPGNAFAQRSNTTATMPANLPTSARNELGQFDFGTKDLNGETEHTLARSNTTPPNLSSYTNPKAQPRYVDTSRADEHAESQREDEPVQAYASVNARLKAFMQGLTTGTVATSSSLMFSSSFIEEEPEEPDPTGVGLGLRHTSTTSTRRTKAYLCVDEQTINRDDSGVFGRMSVLGSVPGRREFSEPQFCRYSSVRE